MKKESSKISQKLSQKLTTGHIDHTKVPQAVQRPYRPYKGPIGPTPPLSQQQTPNTTLLLHRQLFKYNLWDNVNKEIFASSPQVSFVNSSEWLSQYLGWLLFVKFLSRHESHLRRGKEGQTRGVLWGASGRGWRWHIWRANSLRWQLLVWLKKCRQPSVLAVMEPLWLLAAKCLGMMEP